jgi:hypothetical protein
MKKIFSLVVLIAVSAVIFGCTDKKTDKPKAGDNSKTTSASTTGEAPKGDEKPK